MIEPWFDPNLWAWLPGTFFGCAGGVWGALAGLLAPAGKGRGLVMGLGSLLVLASLAFLAAGAAAWGTGQPFGVWFFLLLPGLQGVLVLGPLVPLARVRYRQAEERRMQAGDFN